MGWNPLAPKTPTTTTPTNTPKPSRSQRKAAKNPPLPSPGEAAAALTAARKAHGFNSPQAQAAMRTLRSVDEYY